jgi:hypothetical protein
MAIYHSRTLRIDRGKTMSVDLINKKGRCWYTNNAGWRAVLRTAVDHRWEPPGTVLYKDSGLHPDMKTISDGELTVILLDGARDNDLCFEQATKSGELDSMWDGRNYMSHDGQIITSSDRANIAEALIYSIREGEWREDSDLIQELVSFFKEGDCRIT